MKNQLTALGHSENVILDLKSNFCLSYLLHITLSVLKILPLINVTVESLKLSMRLLFKIIVNIFPTLLPNKPVTNLRGQLFCAVEIKIAHFPGCDRAVGSLRGRRFANYD